VVKLILYVLDLKAKIRRLARRAVTRRASRVMRNVR
jgi:hypothetical protein